MPASYVSSQRYGVVFVKRKRYHTMDRKKTFVFIIIIIIVAFVGGTFLMARKKDHTGEMSGSSIQKEDKNGKGTSDSQTPASTPKETKDSISSESDTEELSLDTEGLSDNGAKKDKSSSESDDATVPAKPSSEAGKPSTDSTGDNIDGLEENELPIDPLN